MRVIGGISRGRRLVAPPHGVRPTGERVREAIFDILGSLGGVEDRSVVDLFAGSGALGVEALSRGAAVVTFVDSDRKVVPVIERNAALVCPAPSTRVRVVVADAISWLAGRDDYFDVALCDPPYAYENWPMLLPVLNARIAVLESDRPISVPDRFEVRRGYRYGGTLVTLAMAHPGVASKGSS